MAHYRNWLILIYLNEDEYLLIADYYTKYPFVRIIPNGQSTSKCVVDITKQIFSEHGIPQIVRSDNWPHFQGPYHRFSKEYGLKHVTSSPNYPKSNGFIESQVKIVKKVLKKAQRSNSDPNIALLYLRWTPIDNKLPSPAQLLLGRQIQDNLPKKITQVMKSFPGSKKDKHLRNSTMISIPTFCPASSLENR